MIQFVSFESESQDPEFQKVYLKLIDEEPTRVMPNDMEKLVASSSAIVALFERTSDGCMIARPDPAIATPVPFGKLSKSRFGSGSVSGYGVNQDLSRLEQSARPPYAHAFSGG